MRLNSCGAGGPPGRSRSREGEAPSKPGTSSAPRQLAPPDFHKAIAACSGGLAGSKCLDHSDRSGFFRDASTASAAIL